MTGSFFRYILVFVLTAAVSQPSYAQILAIRNVTIINVTNGMKSRNFTVLIDGTRITDTGRYVRVPEGSTVIDGSGKYLIPGMWDMHVHLGDGDFDRDINLKLFISNGITGVRFMDGDPAYHRWRQEIAKGTIIGPRMIIPGEVIGSGRLSNITPTQSREAVRKAKSSGADFIKVHDQLSRESYFALIAEAKRAGLPVAGHIPGSVSAEEAARAGHTSIEHATGLEPAKADRKRADGVIRTLRSHGTWLCPTIAMRSIYAARISQSRMSDPRLRFGKSSWLQNWTKYAADAEKVPSDEWMNRAGSIRREKALVAEMARNGVGILAGTDVPNPFILPGFGLHDELTELVAAGLTPLQALQAATSNPARYLGLTESMGTVSRGKVADLVLLNADPLSDINNIKRIHSVIVKGRHFTSLDIDEMQKAATVKGR